MSVLSNAVGAGVQREGAFIVGYIAITKCCDHRCHRHKGGALEASDELPPGSHSSASEVP